MTRLGGRSPVPACFLWFLLFLLGAVAWAGPARAENAGRESLEILFLGDDGHHRPVERFRLLRPVLEKRGIELTYTDEMGDLNPQTLSGYDGLLIYANTTEIEPEQERALLDFVAGGKGLIPVHCASYCFLNSPEYIELVGAQFQRHGTGVFRTTVAAPHHPVMRGFSGFESWDETYVHHKHNTENRTVLSHRIEDDHKEPWTWVRTHEKGRVFYTAWGHDGRTWTHPGFHNLIERGIRWAVGGDPGAAGPYEDRPEMTSIPEDARPLEYTEAEIPYYPAGEEWGVTGEPIQRMQLPLPPEESMKHMVTPRAFHVKRVAAEPEIVKPMCMNWDERGRLWIAETVDYPNDKHPDGEGNDRITICEDTDGDGRVDEFTVFADGMSIPTSLAFAFGGVIVHQPPHTLFLKDTDGDDVADIRKVLFSGWSTRDTHAGPSNLRYGPDNWFYGIMGYAGFRGEVGGEEHSFRTGFYRFKVEQDDQGRVQATEMEFLRNTSNNSWGVGFSEEGQLFGSTANGNPSVHLAVPNRYYERVRGWSSRVLRSIALDSRFDPITENVRQVDHHGRFTAGAGHALYTARTYPQRYWNRTAFVNGPTGHLTATFTLQKAGSSYWSRNSWNLLASDDEWTAPIMAEVGPDGHVWIIDWYNYIVQHNPTPPGYQTGKGNAYETDLRDKKHGRIYRVEYEDAEPPQPVDLSDASPEELVQTLTHSNMLWRLHAQRLLVERGELDVLPQLVELAQDRSVDEIGLNPGVMHALWTLHGLGAINNEHPKALHAAVACLNHPSAGVRQNAARVLPATEESLQAVLDSGVLQDGDLQVRLAAILAVSEMPASPQAAEAVAAALGDDANLSDRWVSDALTCAAARNALGVLTRVAQADAGVPNRRFPAIIERVAEHYARSDASKTVESLLRVLPEADRRVTSAILAGLSQGWPNDGRVQLAAETENELVGLLSELDSTAQSQLIGLALRWGSDAFAKEARRITGTLLSQVKDGDRERNERLEAARSLIEFRPQDSETAAALLDLITPQTPPELAAGLLEAVRQSTAAEVGGMIVGRLAMMTPAVREAALRTLLSRGDWTRSLLEAIEGGRVQWSDLSLVQKQRLSGHPNDEIAALAKKLLERGGALPNPDRQKILKQLMPLTRKTGDAAAGRAVFKEHCAKCHRHGAMGEQIGPDLTGMAVHPKAELLTQVIDPNRNVEGNFRMYTVLTDEGRVINGMLASETRTSLELYDTEGKRHLVLREDVDRLVASNKSVMPEGFEKQLSEAQLIDLLTFLTQRDRFLPIPLQKAATIVSTEPMFYGQSPVERLVFEDWSTKTVDGVPFRLIDPQDGKQNNVVMLRSRNGNIPPRMPESVELPCNAPAESIHLLSGIGGWAHPVGEEGTVSMIVRLHYADGSTEDHALKNGIHFADYIRRIDVPGSKFAFDLDGRQVRYLAVRPETSKTIERIEFLDGPDSVAPIVMAVTVEVSQAAGE